MNNIRWFAHKALGNNRLRDIVSICKTNASGIELDVQFYKNKLVLHHDLIRYNTDMIEYPLLSDALNIIKDTDKTVLLDIKGIDKDINVALELEKVINNTLVDNDKILISSFNESYLSEIHTILPEQKLGYITCNTPYKNFNFIPKYISFLSLDCNIVNQNVVTNVKNTKRELFVWTIKNKDNLDRIKHINGIDYFISDVAL
jgi:glycerophosphoryl diester phosphodiesterase